MEMETERLRREGVGRKVEELMTREFLSVTKMRRCLWRLLLGTRTEWREDVLPLIFLSWFRLSFASCFVRCFLSF